MKTENEVKRAHLMRYLAAKRAYNAAADEYEDIVAGGVRAVEYSDMPRGSPTPHGLEEVAIRAERQLGAVRRAGSRLARIRAETEAAINTVSDETQRIVLCYRYLAYRRSEYEQLHQREGTRQLEWSEIAERMSYSEPTVWRLHGEALSSMQFDRS